MLKNDYDRRMSAVTVASSWRSNPLQLSDDDHIGSTNENRRHSNFTETRNNNVPGARRSSTGNFYESAGDDLTSSPILPMTVEKASKLSLHIYTDRMFFQTGKIVSGHLDVKCTSSRVKISTIQVEVVAYEQVKDPNGVGGHCRRVLYKRALLLQGPGTPPTDAVLAEQGHDTRHFWSARKGLTRFRFAFELGAELPSTVHTKLGSVHYEIYSLIGMSEGSDPVVLSTSKEVLVYETISEESLRVSHPVTQSAWSTWGHFGGKGQVEVKCEMDRSVYYSGCNVYVKIKIINESTKNVSSMKLNLIERIKSFRRTEVGRLEPLNFKRFGLGSSELRGKDWQFDCDQLREVVLSYSLPDIRSIINHRSLLEVSFVLQVVVSSSWAKDIVVELPFDVYNSCNVSAPPKLIILNNVSHVAASDTISEASSAIIAPPVAQTIQVEEQPLSTIPEVKNAPQTDSAFQSKTSMYAINETGQNTKQKEVIEYVPEFDDILAPVVADEHPELVQEQSEEVVMNNIPPPPAPADLAPPVDSHDKMRPPKRRPPPVPIMRALSHFPAVERKNVVTDPSESRASAEEQQTFRTAQSSPDSSFCVAESIDNMFGNVRE